MHEKVGGSFRHGMTSCSEGNEFLLFHDKKKSVKFGYHVWEGLQADGKFHYTGQGTQGDQTLTKSNLALIRAGELGHERVAGVEHRLCVLRRVLIARQEPV